ncbi:MAG: hypothetical protein EOM51_00355 [Clostridia bacterium]|nr:hypothetical protein [Clostridia bacterium]
MKSKTSYFNRALFLNLLKRYWPIFAGYCLIWIIVLPIALANRLQYEAASMANHFDLRVLAAIGGDQILRVGIYGGTLMSGVFAIFIAMAAFSYLYNARSVSMMCSLPIKRESVFLSVFTSGLVSMLVINIAVFLISLAVVAASGVFAAGLIYLLQWLAMVSMLNLFFFGFAALVASLTGNTLVLPIIYVILNFTVYVVEMLIKTVMSMFIYGISMTGSSTLAAFSPPVALLTSSNFERILEDPTDYNSAFIGAAYNGWGTLAVYALVGLTFAALALLLIKHRRMETAGDVVAVRPLKPIFKYCLSVGCALVLGLLIFSTVFSNSPLFGIKSMLFMLLFMILGAFIGYFAAEMLMQKTLRVFSARNWLKMGIAALIISAFMLGGEFDVYGIESKVPQFDKVQSVEISVSGENVTFEQAENIEAALSLHRDIISHKDVNESCIGNYEMAVNNVTINYTYKNGKILTRGYNIYKDVSDDIYTLNDLMNSKEAVEYRKNLSVPVSVDTIADAYISYFDRELETYNNVELSPAQAYELYTQCIIPDIDDGTLGKVWLITDDSYYDGVYDCTINFSIEKRIDDNEYKSAYFYTTLTLNAERTKEWISKNYGLSLSTMGESAKYMYYESDSKAYAEKYGYPVVAQSATVID